MPQVDKQRASTAEKAGSGFGVQTPPDNDDSRRSRVIATAPAASVAVKSDLLQYLEESGKSSPQTYICAVCEEPARGFHFGAFTCEGCKSFFGRTCLRRNHERFSCKNSGRCDVIGSNRTSCKACRYRRCINVGMSPLNSRFGRRSKYFKVSMSTAQLRRSTTPTPASLPPPPPSPLPFQPLPILPPPAILPIPPLYYPYLLSNLIHFYSLNHRGSLLPNVL